tara:strand:- start:397 stop:714 length:318 start_codon:yes stop_codon:yes gene_type:complete
MFNVEITEDKIFVSATIIAYNPKNVPRKKVTTDDAIKYLEENSISHGKCIQTRTLNNRQADHLSGTWIFEKKVIKKVDKPAEKVILVKENKTEPKNKSKAKKKDK